MTRYFSSGADVTVRAEDAVLGGVTQAVLTESAEVYPIREFLTDKPVARLCSGAWTLELGLLAPADADVRGMLSAKRFSLCSGTRVTTLTGCMLIRLTETLTADRRTQYTAVIAAADRSVSDAGGAAPTDGA